MPDADFTVDPLAEVPLFEIETPPAVSLADRFIVPPFSVLDRRAGLWQDRKRKWLSMGIQSELGRTGDALLSTSPGFFADRVAAAGGATSVFDPMLCELAVRWFSPVGGQIVDPFAGGSVRGIVAGVLQREYLGIDLRAEQVQANREQQHIATDAGGLLPHWRTGASQDVLPGLLGTGENPGPFGEMADFIFSCPPYADLEVYSDDPKDLSNMSAADFATVYAQIIAQACNLLRPNRFAAWVISDVRDKKSGTYRGLVLNTIDAFAAAGLELYNDLVIVDPVGSGLLVAGGQFQASRKVRRMHQHMLIFSKGDPREAARACGAFSTPGRGKRKGREIETVLAPALEEPLAAADAEALHEYLHDDEGMF